MSKKGSHHEEDISAIVNGDRSKDDRLFAMENEISMLREKIDYLISIIANENRKRRCVSRNDTSGRPQTRPRTGKSDFLCFNCNTAGHLAKDYKQAFKICKKTNGYG